MYWNIRKVVRREILDKDHEMRATGLDRVKVLAFTIYTQYGLHRYKYYSLYCVCSSIACVIPVQVCSQMLNLISLFQKTGLI